MKIALIYLLFFSFWLEKAAGFSLTPIKGVSLLNLTIYLLLVFSLYKALRTRKLLETNNLNKALFTLMLVFTISIPIKILIGEVQNISVWREIVILKNNIEPLLAFFILYNLLETEDECRRAINGLLILFVLSILTMLLVTHGIIEFGRLRVLGGKYSLGRSSGFGNPNDYARYLVLFIPIVISLFLFENALLKRSLGFIFLLISIIGIIITGSRGGILSLLVCILVYLSILTRKKIIRRSALLTVSPMFFLLCGAAYYLAPAQVKDTLEKKINPETKVESIDKYTSGRTRLLRNGLQIFIDSPIYGHGQNSFKYLHELRFRSNTASHNRYLLYLVEYGVIGLIIYLIILAKIYRYLLYNISVTAEFRQKILYTSYFAGFCGYTFSLLGGVGPNSRLPFWIYTAIIYKYSKIGNLEKRKTLNNSEPQKLSQFEK